MTATREVTLCYVHSGSIGYGRLGEQLAGALTADGVDVYDRQDVPEGVDLNVSDRKVVDDGDRRSKRTNAICWVSVPSHARGWFKDQHASIFTMFEADYLPESFRDTLHCFDKVIVPSEQNRVLFGAYHDDVAVVPLGVDPDVWQFRARTEPSVFFDFLIGGSGGRKGVDIAYEAFRLAFPGGKGRGDGPIPRLVMKSPKGSRGVDEACREGLNPSENPNVVIVGGRLSAEDEVALYASAHCYVQPSRGEGFGLQPLQAIAQGMPTILTDAHGHEAFAHLGIGVEGALVKAGYFIYGDHPQMRWWEPSISDVAERMRWVYDHWDRARDAAAISSTLALTEFTWARTAAKFEAAIGGAMALPPGSSDEWFTPDLHLYRVRVLSERRYDIAGRVLIASPGVDYWETADIKRIIFDNGNLDPECIDEPGVDSGLSAEQVERIGAYSAAKSKCPTCGQQVGNDPAGLVAVG
jgi:glycosyltransferase involved in cell wall biosynthesis